MEKSEMMKSKKDLLSIQPFDMHIAILSIHD